MAEMKFGAKQARIVQNLSNEREQKYDECMHYLNYFIEKIEDPAAFKSKYGENSLDNYELGDPELEAIMKDIYRDLILVSQTKYTRTVRFRAIENEELYKKVCKLLHAGGYGVVHDDDTGGFFVVF